MPIYEYVCELCGEFEEFQKNTNPLKECPKCGKEIKKIISKSSFHLSGRGWAKDGYTKEGAK